MPALQFQTQLAEHPRHATGLARLVIRLVGLLNVNARLEGCERSV